MLPNRSTIVAPLSIEKFPKYVEALDIAQRMNCRLAAELRTDEDLVILLRRQHEYEAAVKEHDHLAMSATNAAFHNAIADAGRNPYLAVFYSRLLDQGRRMLHLHFRYLALPAKAVAQPPTVNPDWQAWGLRWQSTAAPVITPGVAKTDSRVIAHHCPS